MVRITGWEKSPTFIPRSIHGLQTHLLNSVVVVSNTWGVIDGLFWAQVPHQHNWEAVPPWHPLHWWYCGFRGSHQTLRAGILVRSRIPWQILSSRQGMVSKIPRVPGLGKEHVRLSLPALEAAVSLREGLTATKAALRRRWHIRTWTKANVICELGLTGKNQGPLNG